MRARWTSAPHALKTRRRPGPVSYLVRARRQCPFLAPPSSRPAWNRTVRPSSRASRPPRRPAGSTLPGHRAGACRAGGGPSGKVICALQPRLPRQGTNTAKSELTHLQTGRLAIWRPPGVLANSSGTRGHLRFEGVLPWPDAPRAASSPGPTMNAMASDIAGTAGKENIKFGRESTDGVPLPILEDLLW